MQLRQMDVDAVVRRLPKAVKEVCEQKHGVYIVGGFIRSVIAKEEINDLDIFTFNKEHAERIRDHLGRLIERFYFTETNNAITIKGNLPYPVQIVTRWGYLSIEDCVNSFDFTISGAGIVRDVDEGVWKGYCDENFYSDLAAKRLCYREPDRDEDSAGSLLRLLKFYRRGYTAPLDDIAAVVNRAVDMPNFDANEGSFKEHIRKGLEVVDPQDRPGNDGFDE